MYIPDLYINENQEEIEDFLHQNSFGVLINQVEQKPWATHIPFVLDQNSDGLKVLHGHIAKENPQWRNFEANPAVLAIFSGAHSYISSSWYDHENVPTWNYLAVHVYGNIRILDENDTLKTLSKLVDIYEKNSENPVRVADFSAKTMLQTRGIVGFEIVITDIQAVKKLSQNRDDSNHQNIILELKKTNNHQSNDIAIAMSKCPRK